MACDFYHDAYAHDTEIQTYTETCPFSTHTLLTIRRTEFRTPTAINLDTCIYVCVYTIRRIRIHLTPLDLTVSS
jgi:hypothetical protein